MKTHYAWGLALVCAGCQASHQNVDLTPEQAMATAVHLANDRCDALYQQHPFEGRKPPQFVGGRWVWMDMCGVGAGDLQARVELAPDGSTNSVNVQMLDNKLVERVAF